MGKSEKRGGTERIAEIARRVPKTPNPEITFSDGERVFTQAGAAGFLGVTRQTIWRWHKEGKLKGRFVGRTLFITESAVKAMLTGRK